MLPALLIPAIISAAAAAGTGVAGAVAQGNAASDAAASAAADRALQMKLAKMRIAAQQEQQAKDLQQGAMQSLMSVYNNQADNAYGLAQRQTAANGDAMGSLARAFLQRRA